MNIVFILSSLSLSGGVKVIVEYANRLAAKGHNVILLTPGQPFYREYSNDISPNVQVIEAETSVSSSITIFDKICLAITLAKLVPKTDAIIATHTPTTVVSFLAGALLRKGTPIWFFQDYLGMFQDQPLEKLILRYALAWHKGALTISRHSKEELENYGINRKIYLVGEGLSHTEVLKPIPAAIRETNKPNFPTIFYLGDPRPRKGMQDFLHAAEIVWKKTPQLFLWIASKESCEIDTNIPHVFFYRPNDELLSRLYGSCDIFISASWWEGFGLPPLEAMACGAPVVTTDSQGVREFARDEENCLMVPPRDPDALAEAILRLIDDQELANRFRENGPITAAQFDWDSAVERFENALDNLINH